MRSIVGAVLAALLIFAPGCGGGGGGGAPPTPLPDPPLTLTFTPVGAGLASPVAIVQAGDGSGRLFVVEQGGQVRILSGGILAPAPFLNLSGRVLPGGEQGLLGLAFPPGFAGKGYFYVNYTRTGDGATVVSRFRLTADPNQADPGSEEVLLTVPQPAGNHNGGHLAFGPDGFLYIALGDGGGANDQFQNGQNPGTLLGSLLRLDVENGATPGGPPYRIPANNPFVADPAALDEIWATGLRNPWRFSFDRLTGDLFLGDVGQGTWEEINFQAAGAPGGANYGWNILEGPVCFLPAVGCVPPLRFEAPVAFYDHGLGCSVTGGFVYRGPGNPGMQGRYFYGDFCSGRVWALRLVGNVWENQLIADTTFSISCFGEDEAGNLYVADYATGTLYRIDQP